MKKFRLLIGTTLISILMTSCYSSYVYNGNTNQYTPMVKVNSQKNPALLFGLIPLNGSKQVASDFVGQKQNYGVKRTQTFVDGLVKIITLGIYTPTTSEYLLPFDDKN